MKIDLDIFYENLKPLRKKFGTLEYVSNKIGMSKSFLWEIENNKKPSLVTFLKLCDFFELTPDELLGISKIKKTKIRYEELNYVNKQIVKKLIEEMIRGQE